MRQENYYGVFDDDDLYPGAKIKIEHSVVQGYLDHPVDLSPFIGIDADTLTAKRSESAEAEKVLFDKIRASISEWERQAAVTKTYDRTLEYINTPTLEHTSNQWIHDDFLNTDKISNMVYEMTTSIVERTNRETYSRDSHPVVWYVSWEVDMHSPKHNCCVEISGVRNKRFTDKAEAQKYIDGRKKAYAKYFQEISPPIPQLYALYYEVNDVLLPGYTIEGKKPVVSTKTADEIISEILGGDSLSMSKKPSVLKKLAEGNKGKTASARGAKDKEEQSI